jgi:hypothetical protein
MHRGLQARFRAAGHENPFELAVAQFGHVGLQRVFARVERGKPEGAVFGRNRALLDAGGLVAQDHGNTRQRSRMQVGKPPGERARRRRLYVNAVEHGVGRRLLRTPQPAGAQQKRPNHEPRSPVPPTAVPQLLYLGAATAKWHFP